MRFYLILLLIVTTVTATDLLKGLYETSGFHCYSRDSMKLPRHLHGKPQTTDPPFDLSVFDETGHKVSRYEPGKVYNVKLEAYVHFRGLMLQPRLCTPSGHIIGSLRGGVFIEGEQYESHGIGFHQCGRLITNDSITHSNDEKKFLAETKWTTPRDIGDVQFVATIATENVLYWEKWRPKTAFLKSPSSTKSEPDPNLFIYNLHKVDEEANVKVDIGPVGASQHPLFEEQKEFLKGKMGMMKKKISSMESENSEDVFDFDTALFESTQPVDVVSEKIEVTASATSIEAAITMKPEVLQQNYSSSKFVDNRQEVAAFMVDRMFKKFSPLNDTVLREDDLKFLNSHAHLQHDFVDSNDIEGEEKCHNVENPCKNEGKCTISKGKTRCLCKNGFVGENCEEMDKCIDNDCTNNSTCSNDKKSLTGYSCKCENGTVGNFCEVTCDIDFCQNGGQCYQNSFGKLACKCVPGTTGRKCEREINECGFGKCQHNAKCVDLFNGYRCECAQGWMGRNCERPCRDIYGSCRVWKREGQCEQMREATEFFDLNCAASCGACVMSNETDVSYEPIQPILLPFSWLLGEWQSHIKGWNNHSTDYPADMNGMGYNETLTFSVAPSLMFGTPYINYTAIMISEDDPTNIHQYNGFLTIQQYKDDDQTTDRGALTTVGNTGVIMIEEGEILDEKSSPDGSLTLVLTPSYTMYKNGTKTTKHPEKMKRWFTQKNTRLLQYMVREFKGRTHKFTKIYKKTKDFKYL